MRDVYPWRRTRGSLTSSSCLGRKPPRALQLDTGLCRSGLRSPVKERRTSAAGGPWRRTRGSLTSSSCLGRKPPRAPQLEETPETPPSSRAEGLLFLHHCARPSGVPRGPATSTGSLASQRHRGKFTKVPCRSRGCIQVLSFILLLTMMAPPFLLRDSCPQ